MPKPTKKKEIKAYGVISQFGNFRLATPDKEHARDLKAIFEYLSSGYGYKTEYKIKKVRIIIN